MPAGADVKSDAAARAAYIEKADAVCASGRTALNKLGPAPGTPLEYRTWLTKAAQIQRRDLARLKALKPLASDASAVASIWNLYDNALIAVNAYLVVPIGTAPPEVAKLYRTMRSAMLSAGSAAQNYGFSLCGLSRQSYEQQLGSVVVMSDLAQLLPLNQPLFTLKAQAARDDKWQTAVKDAAFSDVGSIPSAVSTILSGFGLEKTPAEVATELQQSGAWSATGGGNWGAIGSYIGAQAPKSRPNLQVVGQTLSGIMLGQRPSSGPRLSALYLVNWTRAGGDATKPTDNCVAVLTDYDPDSDSFAAIDPRSGESVFVPFLQLAVGDPWVWQVTEPIAVQP